MSVTPWARRHRCPICGAADYVCGGPTHFEGNPKLVRRDEHMAKMQEIDYTAPGGRKTKVRVAGDQTDRYQQASQRNEEAAKRRQERQELTGEQPQQQQDDAAAKARRPVGTGDVKNK